MYVVKWMEPVQYGGEQLGPYFKHFNSLMELCEWASVNAMVYGNYKLGLPFFQCEHTNGDPLKSHEWDKLDNAMIPKPVFYKTIMERRR